MLFPPGRRRFPTFRVVPDATEVACAAAEIFATAAQEAVRERGRFTVALAGGNTPRALHERLAAARAGELPWERTFVFFGDERCVSPNDPASNYRMAKETLLAHVPVPPAQVFRIAGEAADRESTALRYEETLRGETPARTGGLDLVFLGLGEDGHTLSLFPGSPALKEKSRLVVPSDAPAGVRPRERITLTLPAMLAARRAIFLVSGAAKRHAMAGVTATLGGLSGAPAEVPPAACVFAVEETLFLVDAAANDMLFLRNPRHRV